MSAITIEASWECEGGALVTVGPRDVRAVAIVVAELVRWRVGKRRRADEQQSGATDGAAQPLQRDSQLLEHEQIHFDIAEVTVRKSGALRGLQDACAEAGGPIDSADGRPGRSRIQEEQQRYDRETGHGTNARAQEQWKRRIQAL